jgi:class 3 adenylate cyclase
VSLTEFFTRRGRQKIRLQKIFAPYSGYAAVNLTLDSRRAQFWEKEVFSLVTHLHGFETLFTSFALGEIALLINRYYELIARVVLGSEGDVTQFCGPEVIAHYGLIRPVEESSIVTPVKEALREIERTLESEFHVQFSTGMCRGTVIFGSFGSSQRRAFTTFGPPVNCAQRLSIRNSGFNVCESITTGSSILVLPADGSISVHQHWNQK